MSCQSQGNPCIHHSLTAEKLNPTNPAAYSKMLSDFNNSDSQPLSLTARRSAWHSRVVQVENTADTKATMHKTTTTDSFTDTEHDHSELRARKYYYMRKRTWPLNTQTLSQQYSAQYILSIHNAMTLPHSLWNNKAADGKKERQTQSEMLSSEHCTVSAHWIIITAAPCSYLLIPNLSSHANAPFTVMP